MWVKGELFDDFAAAEASALGRLDRDAQPWLFDRLSWIRLLWAHCPPGKMPLIARARAENTDAWLYLARVDENHAVALANWYTLAFRPVFSGEAPDTTKRALLTALARRLATGLSSITLSPMPERDGSADLLMSGFRKGGWLAFKTPKTINWTVDVTGKSFADYWGERPGQVRSTHDRKLKKFGVTTEITTKFDEDAWAIYEEIYADSWKGEEGSPDFVRAMAVVEGKAGTLRLGIARHEGRPIAAQLWTVENGIAIIHKLAYREDAGEMSAGTILTAAMFRHAIDADHATLIDYGTGDEGYKAEWMDQRDTLHTINLFNAKTLSGLFGATKAALSGVVRRGRVS
jgi:hypothetical protein